MGVNTMNETTNKPINNAGRIGFNIRGYYSENDTYDFLDVVYYGNSSYVAKQTTVGNTPAENNAFWQILARGIGENVDTPNYWKLTSQNGKGVFEQNGTTWIVTVPTMAQASDAATAWWMVKLSTITEYTVKFGIVGGTDDDSAYVNVSSTTNSHYQFSKVGNGEAVREVKLPKDAWVWMKFQHYSNTADAHAYLILEPVVLIDEQRPTFTQAATRTNIASGNSMNILFGKIMKWFADFKNVAFTGSYNDLSNKPTIPAAVAVKGNAESTYRTGNVNLTPANIGAVATSKVLSTKEQINANTNTANVAGATAVKAMVSEINSNLAGVKFKIVKTVVPEEPVSTNIYKLDVNIVDYGFAPSNSIIWGMFKAGNEYYPLLRTQYIYISGYTLFLRCDNPEAFANVELTIIIFGI